MRNCAIIGFGNWGRKISESVYLSKKFNIKYILDPTYVDKSFYNTKKCSDIKKILLDQDIEDVFIFTSNDKHKYYAELCANYDKNIFLEKPICNTSKDSLELLELCKKKRVKLMIGHNVKYYSIFKKVYELINNNYIGKIYHIEANRSRPIWKSITQDSWRFYKKTCNGGPLIQMALHMIDTINFLLGYLSYDIKVIGTNYYLKSENCETYNIIGKLQDNITFYLYTSYLPAETFYINIYGENGTIFADVNRGLFYQKIDSVDIEEIYYKENFPELDEIYKFDALLDENDINYSNVEDAIKDVMEVEKILNECNR